MPVTTRLRGHLLPALVLAAGCGVMAGCSSTSQSLAERASAAGWPIQDGATIAARPAPRPTAVDHRHDVGFAADAATLAATEEERLRAFLAATGLRSGDRVYIAPGDPADPLADRRRANLSAFLLLQGIAVASAPAELTAPAQAADRLTVIIRRIAVALPECPDWTAMPGDTFSNRPASFFGCASAVNLGMMVAEPADLARGRDPGPADPTVAARAVERYRRGKTKDLIRDAASGDIFPAEDQQDSGDMGGEK